MGSQQENFCLRWSDFESNLSAAFQELRDDSDFFDVTLATDEDQVGAHRVVLSACSPHLKEVLRKHARISGGKTNQNLLVYLRGVRHCDLLAVLEFMYCGSVNVAQDDLNSFLAVAEDLKVRGLTQNIAKDSSSTPSSNSTKNGSGVGKRSKPSASTSAASTPSNPPKRFRPAADVAMKVEAKEDVPLDDEGEYHEDQQEFEYEEEGDGIAYDEGDAEAGPSDPDAVKGEWPEGGGLQDFIDQNSTTTEDGILCLLCGVLTRRVDSTKRHFKEKHLETNIEFVCPKCQQSFHSRNRFRNHIYKNHRGWRRVDFEKFKQPRVQDTE